MTVLMIERVTEGESGGQQRGSAISRRPGGRCPSDVGAARSRAARARGVPRASGSLKCHQARSRARRPPAYSCRAVPAVHI